MQMTAGYATMNSSPPERTITMCTAFIHKGHDVIFGFNMDLNAGALVYDLYATEDWFGVGCPADLRAFAGGQAAVPAHYQVSDGIRRIHGVHRQGVFAACLNSMNATAAPFRLADDACSIDQMTDDLLAGRRSLEEVCRFADTVELTTLPPGAVDVPDPGFHVLSADVSGNALLLESGNGYAVLQGNYAILTNFPLLQLPADLSDKTAAFYGKDRYDTALSMLRAAGDDLSPAQALNILQATRQNGQWATRVSFVFSCREKTVYYCLEGDFDHIMTHRFP